MLNKVAKGELSGFKSKLGSSDIPKEALPFLTGLNVENSSINIEHLGVNYELETNELNALELACVYGHSKIVNYIVDELNMKSAKDF